MTGARVIRPAPRPDADRVLICLSYSGGGTAKFRSWAAATPDHVEVAAVCYPGREGRFTEPFARNWDELLDDVMTAIRPLTDQRPYVLFGHSLGGWVAFDAALRLVRSGARHPSALVVSACEAPVDWHLRQSRTPHPDDSDEALLSWMRRVGQLSPLVLAEPDLREIAVDLLRADMRVSRSYRHRPGDLVTVPVQVLHAAHDPAVSAEAAGRWRLVADGPIQIEELPGEHFYTDAVWATLPEQIAALAPAPATPI
ncbi:thioesterase II family protein [Micromonospora tarensis]|uniref:Thioesterase n=1 Tax=Micromonospora tarensis TaxID=2806100 RepID=A0ABS1YAI3_9ACTN|nr:alpha/beta fold hydrolase [Micromonospora tarensis]MBM0274421.1 thioesterase [Micromonospora tarensis]